MVGRALLGAVVGLVLAAPIADAEVWPAKRLGAIVGVHDNFFDPHSVKIDRGESVRWSWKGRYRHNLAFKKVPAGAGKRRVKSRSAGQVSRTFGTPGIYRYVCTLYAGMEGTVTVSQ